MATGKVTLLSDEEIMGGGQQLLSDEDLNQPEASPQQDRSHLLGGFEMPGKYGVAQHLLYGGRRGLTDLRERIQQMLSSGKPGEVIGSENDQSTGRFSDMEKSLRAKKYYEEALGRDLSEDEMANIKAEPNAALEMARNALNRKMATGRREFENNATVTDQVARFGVNVAPALAIRTPGAIAGAGVPARILWNTMTGGAMGATEFVQPGQSRAQNALIGAGTSAAVGSVMEGVNAARPSQIIGRKYQAAQQSPQAEAGRNVAARTGGLMDVAEETQDPALMNMRNTALQSDTGQRMARDFNNQQLVQQRKLAEGLASRRTIDDQKMAEAIEDVTGKKETALYKIRNENADKNYADVRSAMNVGAGGTEWSGAGQPLMRKMVSVKNIQAAVTELESRYPGIGKALTKSHQFLRIADKNGGLASIDDIINFERTLRGIKYKGGKITQLYDTAGQDKMLAKDLYEQGLIKDLQETESVVGQNVYGKLQKAINSYRTDSDAIREVAGVKLGNASTPEGLAESIRTARTSQIKKLFEWADEYDPALKQKATKYLFRSAIDKAKDRTLVPVGHIPFDRQTFLKQVGIGEDKLFLLTRGDRKAQQAVADTIELVKRTQKQLNIGNAGDNIASNAGQGAALAGTAIQGNVSALATFGPKFLAKRFTGPVLAKLMFNPEGQQALRTLARAPTASPTYAAAVAYFNKIANEPEEGQEEFE